ncbi:hypothetical protein JQX13_48455 [Archangium violaceum]|uniref:hypothetical protein n=1 Tax=Archangium violaceum TaxID=83451 RepID=UPI00193BFB59|nr:hypothetical protein [Archangium violaceum]QRK07738.1 hypothetical protein JQX13_48455 [Archangium violaceum]
MKNSWRTSVVMAAACAVVNLGCSSETTQQPTENLPPTSQRAPEPVAVAKKAAALDSNTLLYCQQAQDEYAHFELVKTSTGYEAALVSLDYDPWDCRCEYEKREVLGTYTSCRVSTTDSRIVTCYKLESNGTIGKVALWSTRISNTQLPLTSGPEYTYQELNVAAVNQNPGYTPRRDFKYDLADCQGQ